MTTSRTDWPDTRDAAPPTGHQYLSATWLLGQYPRLAQLARRIHGAVEIEDEAISIDLHHLADVLSAVAPYSAAWEAYETQHRPPGDDEYDAWLAAGPRADDFADGLADFLVMSSGEIAALRLLATLASTSSIPPFGIASLRSLDAEGQRLVDDWCMAIARTEDRVTTASVGTIRRRSCRSTTRERTRA